MHINVIGAGLAGCEAAFQSSQRGLKVYLYEMKPQKKTPAHKSDMFSELVCSNSLKADRVESAAGMLKEEMRVMNSLLMECADLCRVPAGGALAVDRDKFSAMVTDRIRNHPNIQVVEKEVLNLDEFIQDKDGITVIASGPLTSESLSKSIQEKFGGALSFFDAASCSAAALRAYTIFLSRTATPTRGKSARGTGFSPKRTSGAASFFS